MADLPVRDTARPLTTLGAVEPVIHMLCGTDFRLSLSAGIEHMFAQESAKRRCSFPGCGRPHLAKGLCAVAITSNREPSEPCNHCPPDLEVTPRAALWAARTLP
jgi:hypothetical protein